VSNGSKDQLAVESDPPVLDDERDVELAAGEPKSIRVGIVLIPRVLLHRDEVKAGPGL